MRSQFLQRITQFILQSFLKAATVATSGRGRNTGVAEKIGNIIYFHGHKTTLFYIFTFFTRSRQV